MPSGMRKYISNYGFHFNKKAYLYAASYMKKKNNRTNKEEVIEPYTKEYIDELLKNNNVEIKNKVMYDYVYVALMCKADFLGSSIEDDKHLALYIKDSVDDVDASNDTTFRRWLAAMIGNGNPIDWDELL